MSLAHLSLSALLNICTFTIFLFSNCLQISFNVPGDAPSLPTHTVGFSKLSSRFIRSFALDEIKVLRAPPFEDKSNHIQTVACVWQSNQEMPSKILRISTSIGHITVSVLIVYGRTARAKEREQ